MAGLLILGAGGHGKVIAEMAHLAGRWDAVAFLDDKEGIREAAGFPVIGKLDDRLDWQARYPEAFVAIGHNGLRMHWIGRLQHEGFRLPALVHPAGTVSRSSRIGAGTAVMAGAVVNADAAIGAGCIVNTCASVDHDCVLEDGVHVSPGACVGGAVRIGRCSWICIGASVANHVAIGRHATVAAGAAVIRDIPDGCLAAGVPAIIKKSAVEMMR